MLLEPGPVDPIAGDRQPNIGSNARDGRQGVHDQVEALVRDDAAEAEQLRPVERQRPDLDLRQVQRVVDHG